MTCKCCGSPMKRHGTYKTKHNGTIQRYYCAPCRNCESDTDHMNRLPQATRQYALDLIRNGNSVRNVARKAMIHTATASRLVKEVQDYRRERIAKGDGRYIKRDRRAYLKQYYAKGPLTHHHKLIRNDRIRGAIAILLAEAVRPLTLDEIHAKILLQFPDVKKSSVGYMLNVNCEDVFEQVGTDHWTYRPSELYIPILTEKHKYPERDIARAAWFKKYNLCDPVTAPIIESMLQKQKERLIEKRLQVADAARDHLQHFVSLQAVARAISTTLNEHKS